MRKARDFKRLAAQRMFKGFGTLAGATAIYGGIYVVIVMAILVAYTLNLVTQGVFASAGTMEMYMDEVRNSLKYYFTIQIVVMLVGAIMSTISVSIMYMCLKTARGQEIKLSDLLYVVKNNPDKVIIIYLIQELLMFLFSIPANMITMLIDTKGNTTLEIVSYALLIFGYVADIYITTMFSQALFLYIDDPMENPIRCIEMSMHVMKRHIGRYIMLFISFIPLYVLAAFTFGIMYIWILPYQNTTFALFYMQLKGELGSTIDVTIQ